MHYQVPARHLGVYNVGRERHYYVINTFIIGHIHVVYHYVLP